MRFASVYYENPGVSSRYFKSSLTSICNIFHIGKIELKHVDKISNITLDSYSPYPRILLMQDSIKAEGCSFNLDGIGLVSSNIAMVHYQDSFTHTIFLLAHEMGHLLGMPHCSSHHCLMGVYKDDRNYIYAWRKLTKRKLSSDLFCHSCKSFLHSRRIAMLAGG